MNVKMSIQINYEMHEIQGNVVKLLSRSAMDTLAIQGSVFV